MNIFIEMLKRNHSLIELWIRNCNLSKNGKQKNEDNWLNQKQIFH